MVNKNDLKNIIIGRSILIRPMFSEARCVYKLTTKWYLDFQMSYIFLM